MRAAVMQLQQCRPLKRCGGPRSQAFLTGSQLATRRGLPQFTRAMHTPVQSKVISNFSPHDTLGVGHDAGLKEIKRAFRKMALKHHPDREGGSEENFLLVVEAYEVLTGKNPERDPSSKDSWEYHDWFWKFASNRRKGKRSGPRWSQSQMKSQLAGLRHRAAVRANKAQHKICPMEQGDSPDVKEISTIDLNHSNEDFIDSAEAPADSGGNSLGKIGMASGPNRAQLDTQRRVALNGNSARNSVTSQLAGLRRKSKITNEPRNHDGKIV